MIPIYKTGDDISLFGIGCAVREVTKFQHFTMEQHYLLATYADSDPTKQSHEFFMPCYFVDNVAEPVNIT